MADINRNLKEVSMKDFVKCVIDWAEAGVCVAVGVAAYKLTKSTLDVAADRALKALEKEEEVVEVQKED